MSAIAEQSNEISKTNGMSETDKEWLATDWERSDQGSILCFRIVHEERYRIFNQVATCLISRTEEDGRNCHDGRNINR